MCIRDSSTTDKISILQSRIKEIDSLHIQNYNDVHDKYNLVESDLTRVKNELRGRLTKN